MNAFEKQQWESFLENALGGLQMAAAELRGNRAGYENRRDWFRSKTSGIPRENSVTQALAEVFGRIRSQHNIKGAEPGAVDLRHISVACERPRPRDVGISDMSNPTDLSLVFMKGGELDLRIEAKTVLNDKEVKSQYLGKSGLDRFEDGANPYTVQPFGGMVAYVVDLDGASWSEKIVAELEAKVGSTRLRSIVLNGGTHAVSNHAFDLSDAASVTRKEVDVVHFVIEIDAKPSRR